MRRYLLAAVAAAAIASPAAARDGSGYVGIEGGVMLVEDTDLDYERLVVPTPPPIGLTEFNDALSLDYSMGFDVDLIGGYDFGMVRGELELGYKRASIDEIQLGEDLFVALPNTGAEAFFVEADGRGSVLSAMANLLLDFGDDTGWSGYLGGGVGAARVKLNADFDTTIPTIPGTEWGFNDTDSALAWQLIAGLRTALSESLDVGVKYRYFNTRELKFEDGVDGEQLTGKWKSHSLLASLIFNFAPPPPPPPPPLPPAPPPPPPPATQTCPDGTVILATEVCPVPPPPPPPPPPAPERG